MGVLVAVVIGVSLLAFILGDFLRSGSQVLNKKRFEIAEINGRSISYVDFQTRVENSVESYKNNSGNNAPDESTLVSIRNQVWNNYLNELIMEDEFESLGLMCSGDELFDMVQGTNIHPQMQALDIFKNQMTGEFDRNLVIQFLKNMENDPRAKAAWLDFENSLVSDRVYTKYQNMIAKGLYVTRAMVEDNYQMTQKTFDLSYISERFVMVSDSLVSVTDADVKAYYNAHKNEFEQEASVDLAYVAFDIVPSEQDRQVVQEWINNEVAEFSRIPNTEQYVNLNGDSGFDAKYYLPSELEEQLQPWADTAKVGSVFGPYLVDDTWKLAKMTDMKMLPDSVRASHILIRPDETGNIQSAQVTADSLVDLLKKGADFAALAAEFGTDATAQTGGDLDWFMQGQMVSEFDQAAFFGNKGDLTTVTTEFGVHVLKITDQGAKTNKMQVGILDRHITFGQETYQKTYAAASRFAATYNNGNKFEDGVVAENLTKRVANGLREADRVISGLENPRQMIIWAFESEKGDLSEIYEFGNRFVIAKVTEKREAGLAPLDQVYGEVESTVRNQKKGDYLVKKFNDAKGASLDQTAQNLNMDVKTINRASFGAYSIPGVGVEPKVSAAFARLQPGQISEPIKGANGVFILRMDQAYEPETPMDFATTKAQLAQEYQSRSGYQAFEALQGAATVVDKRNKFY